MMHEKEINCDVLVIGRGLAGMAAAARSASFGLKTVQAGSSAGFFLYSGLMDLLGVYPVEKQAVLPRPEPGFDQIRKEMPAHPYGGVSFSKVLESLSFVASFLKQARLMYQSDENRNSSVLTAAGTFKPSYLIPKTFAGGGIEKLQGQRVLFVDFKGMKGFSARQVANVLHRICPQASVLTIDVPGYPKDITPAALAAMFEKDDFLSMVIDLIKNHAQLADRVGLPAVCGMNHSHDIIKTLTEKIGCPCFEIPGLLPSIPGIRLRNAFEDQLSEKSVIVLNNSTVSFKTHSADCFSMTARAQNMETRIRSRCVILASGRFQGKGLHASRGQVRETVFGLPVYQPGQRNQWYAHDFFHPHGHAINQAGVETNDQFQPIDESRAPLFDHLYAAGTILAHNDWMRLKSGAGVSCVSAITAVDCFYEALTGERHV
jgi:glycerol-3-phosphate dehydrogenase subunit B